MSFIEQQLATTTITFLSDAKPPTASMKKLIKSPFFDLFGHDLTSDEEEDVSTKALEAPTIYLTRVQSLTRYAQHLFVNWQFWKNYNRSTP